jgi:hypothetical protein
LKGWMVEHSHFCRYVGAKRSKPQDASDEEQSALGG